ncbi:autotransporter domain-containing protein [Escherichia coli]|uniref:BigA/YdbA N-terminal beta-barrel domain-containing protein n=1 Tax=Escherichia coli TaxID=562 RepID=UPI000BE52006|nr:autotransporter domain-containing protein [Escherichia coli]
MQRKTLLSACIALALSGQGWAADITEIETTTGEKKNTNVTCPADPGKLSPEELKRLPSECSPVVEQNLMPWLATGAATALITALAIVELNDDDDHHHRNNSPLPPTPPDDNSDDTPVPPTPGGDEIIPDDGSDDTPTPPKPISFNNDVILDKTAKTLTIRDSVFTYTENADGTISLQDSNGRKATINIWQIDEANNTVALDGVSADGATKWQYNHNGELVITGDNATVNNNGKTIVDGKDSTGTEIAGNNGKVIQDGTLDVSGGGHGIDITGDSATVDNKGGMTVTDPDSIGILIDGDKAIVNNDGDNAISNGGTGTQVNGDEATVNNNGNTTVDGQGSTGTEIAGNNAVVNQDGTLDVSGGGHGIDITGDSATVDNKGGMTVTDPDSIGILIDGDKAIVNNDGDNAISNGGTGTQVNGDEATVNNNGNTTVDGQGSTGTEIAGNNAVVNQDGTLDVSGGGHGIDITGDSATVDNKGGMTVTDPDSIGILIDGDKATVNNNGKTTVDGQGSTGTEIAGNNAVVNQDGTLDVSGGAHGIDITGNGAIANTTGAITVADTDSVGIQVDGNEATVSNDGDSTITNGGTGTQVNGNDAQVNNTGNTTVDGKNSTGTEITGNNGTVNLDGSLIVTGGAYGVEIVGDSATLNNEGDISVADEGSIGVLINGEKATVSNTGDVNVSNNATGFDITTNEGNISLAGSMQVGDFSTGMDLNGNNNSVTLAAKDLNVTGQKATGVNVSGDANTINITGNVLVDKDQTADNAADYFYDPSVGINVSGSNNNVTLDGKLTVVADSELTTRNSAGVVVFDGSQENITGLSIAGDGNTFRLNGGIQLVGEANKLTDGSTIASERKGSGKVPLVSVDGKSSVHLNGDSTISGDVLLGNTQIIDLRNGAMLDVGADATINMQVDTYERYAMSADHLIDASSGSQLVNNGDINLRSIGFAAITGEDSFGSNTGNLTLSQYLDGLFANGGYGYLATKGASVVNTGTITTKVAEQESVINLGASLGFNDLVFYNAANSMTGLSAKTHGYVLNENGGKIEMFGRGNVGMLAIDESTAENAGQITLDALWVDVNDTTTLRDNIGNDARGYSVGMGVGTDAGSGPRKNATAVNQQSGVITVYNAGIGMAAYGAGNTVINQGTINLEKNGNYDSSLGVNSLIGMAAYNSGTAINDQTGVININADNGQAFYSTGNGVILNYGTICVNTNCLTGNDYNDTDSYTSILYTGGDVITAQSETQSLTKKATISDKKDGNVVNSGALSGADIAISSGKLVNTSTGTINNAIIINGGALSNEGSVAKVTQNAGTFNNTGSVNSRMTQTGGTFNNQQGGTVKNGSRLANSAIANNMGIWSLGDTSSGGNASMLEINNNAVFKNSGDFILDNSKNAVHLNQSGTFYNTGKMLLSNSSHNGVLNFWGGNGRFINGGIADVTAKSLAVSASDAGSSNAFFWNQSNGVVNFDKDSGVAVKFTHSNYVAQNDGTMNISGNNAIAMEGDKNARLVNNGTINLGTSGTTDTGMIGMQLDSGTTADAVIENNGAINIYANNSFAFSMLGSVGHLVNNGTVTIADGVTGSGLIKQGDSVNIEGVNGNNGNNSEVHYADYTLPDVPGSSVSVAASTPSSDGSQNKLNGYVVGTSSDGSAGKLKVNNASLKGVSVNTGFTAGTSSTSVTFDNVVQGSNLTDAETITSTSVVWNAQGTTDASGNVDVTMTKNAYTDVATDSSVNTVAQVLDAGYTNNELYSSLNVGTTAELNSALKQVSGSQATTVFNEARVLSNRFSMLSDAAPEVANGLAFNVVAKGDPRAELGNDTQYDMMALRKSLTLTEHQNLSLEYGIARLEGNGSDTAGDNGVTGGYSQFFGLKHQMAFDNGMNWNNALRYDVHQLDSSRSVAYGDINKTADANVKQQYLEFRSEGAKTFELREGLNVTPYAGVKLRHTLEGGYQERNAGDFNLSMNSGSETAVDSIVGLKLDYAGKDGWSANATLEGGPNLSYVKSQRTASVSGAGSQRFNIDDGQNGGGFNSLATMGVKYSSQESALQVDAFHWKEDGISDKGVMLNFKKTF